MQFEGLIEIRGINPFVLVNAGRAQEIHAGWRKPMPVLAQLNGKPDPAWRINMMPGGNGSFFLYLDGGLRKRAGADIGDTVAVRISFDPDYRNGPQHAIHPAFAARLESSPEINARWEALAPGLRKEVLRYLANLKSEAARARNVERAIRVLSGAKERFMARDWN
ncbi:YdeI/OmpD-associated family protein [Sphingomonas psychrotolerans]|uniref:YdeI/OmpD-associated family protein n=1 Tax=Sphingomonas psychrotolerans TaxID=1327635 RepID=A0ABU3MZM4_9SPHN|nr:YdeI/OmpD-associated family protein [Sphingomonas psychrotolerans]MDT8757754.1 YdeI/OmpD-associated family protein [Sphingomonas psychrotolerans]